MSQGPASTMQSITPSSAEIKLNREAEQAVLGCAIVEPQTVVPQLKEEKLQPQHFYLLAHRTIYQTIVELFDQGEPIDLITLGNRLEEKGELGEIGGRSYLSNLVGAVTTTTSVGYYARILIEHARRWELHQKLLEAAEKALRDPDAALDEVVAQAKRDEAIKVVTDGAAGVRLEFPKDGFIGLGADFADLYSQAVESPKSFLYSSFLTCLGALIGDRVALRGATRNPARLYTVLLGPSGSARKSTAIKLAVDFFARSIQDFPVIRGIGSAEGLAKVIKERNYTNVLLTFDELRAFVDKARIDGSVLLSLVNSLFEDSRAENHTKRYTIELENVHLSLLSACTLDTFSNLFDQNFIAIGFPNRLFLVLDEAKERKPVPRDVDREQEIKLQQRLGAILAGLRGYTPENPLLVGLTPEAEELWAKFYTSIPNTMSGIRIDQIGLRFAMLLAVSSEQFEIDPEMIRAAIAICRWELAVREEVMPIEAANAVAALEERIRRVLKSRGPLRERDLKRHVNASRAGLWVFEAAKSNLERAGEIIFEPRNRVFALLDNENVKSDQAVISSVVTSENGGLC